MEGLSRQFLAVPLAAEARLALADRLPELPGRPTPPQNWHLTLRFLGLVDEVTAERVMAEVSSAALGPPFEISLSRLGAFPGARKATVLWVGISKGVGRLSTLAELTEEAAQAAGLSAEDRPFRPHLTLARIRPPQDVTRVVDESADMGIRWRCDRVVLYESHLGAGPPRYEPLESFELVG